MQWVVIPFVDLCFIVLPDCVWTSSNIIAPRAEMNPFDRSSVLQALLRIQ